MANELQTIVVVGGGFAGATIAKDLSAKIDMSKHRLILITASQKFVYLPATIRCVTTSEGQLENQAFMSYGEFLGGKGEIKVAIVESFSSDGTGRGGEAKLSTGETVMYDILVLASGSRWPSPISFPNAFTDVQSHLDSWRAKIEKAKSIVLVGGGAVGIEFAGEIADFHKGKNVTIVHGARLPLNETYPDRFRNALLTSLRSLDVNFVLEDTVKDFTPSEDGTLTTKKGKVLNADLVIPTFCVSPNTGFIGQSLGSEVLSASKHVKILPTLQLPGHSNIFAAGDIIDWDEQRQAAKSPAHAAVVVKNILSGLNGQEAVAHYKGSYELIAITLGRSHGVSFLGILWGIVLGDWLSAMLKSNSLMIEKTRKHFGF